MIQAILFATSRRFMGCHPVVIGHLSLRKGPIHHHTTGSALPSAPQKSTFANTTTLSPFRSRSKPLCGDRAGTTEQQQPCLTRYIAPVHRLFGAGLSRVAQ